MQDHDRATLNDVAQRAGVSIATVSRVLNGLPTRESTRALVERTAKELDYSPNRMAQSLRTRATKFIGMIIPDLGHASYARMVKAAQDIFEAADYQVLIMSTHRDLEGDSKAIDAMLKNRVDGMLIASYGGVTAAPPIPTVFLDNFIPDPTAGNVLPANASGIDLLVSHLTKQHGYSQIGYLGPMPRLSASTERLDGFFNAMRKHGLGTPGQWIFTADDDWTAASADQALGTAIRASGLPRALVAASDTLAIGAMHAIQAAGMDVPGDLAVVSFDDPPFGAFTRPSVTALQPVEHKIGSAAARMLMGALTGADGGVNLELRIPPSLITRESCGCVPSPQIQLQSTSNEVSP